MVLPWGHDVFGKRTIVRIANTGKRPDADLGGP
jgi:hypothetical protein